MYLYIFLTSISYKPLRLVHWLEYLSLRDETAMKEISVCSFPMDAMMNDNRLGSLKQYVYYLMVLLVRSLACVLLG